MARLFSFEPASFDVPKLVRFVFAWEHIPDAVVSNAIAVEHQYLEFHKYMLTSIRHADPKYPRHAIPLGLSVRAGIIKAAILLYGSIAEAALRSHAEKRGIGLAPEENRRTFGNVIYSWKNDAAEFPTIEPIWNDLVALLESRNMIHLFKSIQTEKDFSDIIRSEEPLLSTGERVIEFLQKIKSP